MSPAAVIRLACAQDVEEVLALDRATPEAPHWSPQDYSGYIEQAVTSFRRRTLWVGIVEDRIGGFAAASAVLDTAELDSVAVAAHLRCKGIGRQLLAAVSAWAESYGATALLLEVRSSNTDALRFYAAQGFVQQGTRAGYYKNPEEDAILMRRQLMGKARGRGVTGEL